MIVGITATSENGREAQGLLIRTSHAKGRKCSTSSDQQGKDSLSPLSGLSLGLSSLGIAVPQQPSTGTVGQVSGPELVLPSC